MEKENELKNVFQQFIEERQGKTLYMYNLINKVLETFKNYVLKIDNEIENITWSGPKGQGYTWEMILIKKNKSTEGFAFTAEYVLEKNVPIDFKMSYYNGLVYRIEDTIKKKNCFEYQTTQLSKNLKEMYQQIKRDIERRKIAMGL